MAERAQSSQSERPRERPETVARRRDWHARALEAGLDAFFGCASRQDIEDVVRAYLGALGEQGQHTARSIVELYVDAERR